MATRSSSRIKALPKVAYITEDNENEDSTNKKGRTRKTSNKKSKKIYNSDESSDDSNSGSDGYIAPTQYLAKGCKSVPKARERKASARKAAKKTSYVNSDQDVSDSNQSNASSTKSASSKASSTKSASSKSDTKAAKQKPKIEDADDDKAAAVVSTDNGSKKSTRGKRKQATKPKMDSIDEKEMETKKTKIEEKIETKINEVKGKKHVAPVDSHCTQRLNDSQVYSDCDGPWDAMLNQTNVGQNNNKYYVLQLLESSSGSYYTWYRWGRIGYSNKSQSSHSCHGSLADAKKDFIAKFKNKTKNSWEDRADFVKYAGKYDLIKLEYTTAEDDVKVDGEETKVKKEEEFESKLDPRLLSLIELISNVKTMETTVIEMNYDVKKSPLGKLSKEQIKSGYQALKTIEECIKEGKPSSAKAKEACSMFYTRIPHSFGFQTPPMINTLEEVKLKIGLLDTLLDIEAAIKVIKLGVNDGCHKADAFYNNLKLEMKPLEKDNEMFQLLSTYLHNTHGKTHTHYSLVVEDIFELKKEGEEERYVDQGNKQLLWHGSRLTNWGGIFSQGLRIAPPEAPVTGYMFGKGVYFADMASKSANYCFTSRAHPTGLLLLAEVSLGEERELMSSDCYADKLPAGKHSTKGLGKNAPNPADDKVIDGVKIPMGASSQTGVTNPNGYTLEYNEFIVYDVAQVKMKYALRVRFDYKR